MHRAVAGCMAAQIGHCLVFLYLSLGVKLQAATVRNMFELEHKQATCWLHMSTKSLTAVMASIEISFRMLLGFPR